MKYSTILSASLAVTGAFAAPSVRKRAPCTSPVQFSQSQNPFTGRTQVANSHYGDLVRAAANNVSDSSLKNAALAVAEVGTFLWL